MGHIGVVLASLLVAVAVRSTTALQFYLKEGQTLCFAEFITPHTKVLGEYTVAAGIGHMPIDIEVKDVMQKKVMYERSDINHGKFAFIAPMGEERVKLFQSELRRHAKGQKQDLLHKQAAENKHTFHEEHHYVPEHEHGHDWDQHHVGRQTRDFNAKDAKLDHLDAHDGIQDNEAWDMGQYDGIHDEEVQRELDEIDRKAENIGSVLENSERRFEICVSSKSQSNALSRRVRLVLRHGKAAHDYTRLAKMEHLTSLELTLRIVSDELKELMAQLDYARKLEESLRLFNEKTNQQVLLYATLSVLVLIAVSGFQAMYTKRFFKTKKLL